MPCKDLFFDNGQSATENYYAALLHEITLWRGGATRLGREQESKDKKESYAFEELIVELGEGYFINNKMKA